MRVVFIGINDASFQAAKSLQKKGHEIVIIEQERTVIDEMSKQIDCSFLQGDGSRPDILHEVNPKKTDFLFCFSENDQVNIIASLVGRSIGFKKIVTRIDNEQYEDVCLKLGLNEIVIPSRTIGRNIEDIVGGFSDLSITIKDQARLFLFICNKDTPTRVEEFTLPSEAKIICFYREGNFHITNSKTELQKGDEVVVLTHSKNLTLLRETFNDSEYKVEHA